MDFRLFLRKKIVILFLIIPFLQPRGLVEMGMLGIGRWNSINTLFYYMRILVLLLLLFMCLIYRLKPHLISLIALLFELLLVAINIYYGKKITDSISNLFYIIAFILFFELYLRIDIQNLIKIIVFILSIEILLNLFSLIQYPYPYGMYVNDNKWTRNWFLGYYNLHIFVFLPWLCFSEIILIKKKGKISIIPFIIMTFSAILLKSSTTLTAVVIILFLYLIFGRKIKLKIINPVYIISATVLASLLIIKYNIQYMFSSLIKYFFNKSADFTGRISIWQQAVNFFVRHPVLGNGTVYYSIYQEYGNVFTKQSHNTFLDILVQRGIVGLFLFLLMFIIAGYYLYKNNFQKNEYGIILIITLVGYAVVFLTEMYCDFHMIYAILFLMVNIKEINDIMPIPRAKKIKLKLGYIK